jgi:hypothetical protein
MDLLYASFCLADSVFYDSPSRVAPEHTDLAGSFMADREAPAGWVVEQTDSWTYLTPVGVGMPAQGWKIHVSATTGSAAVVLDAVWRYCVPRRIAFKFLPDRVTLLLRNGKYADRGGSGKFITIYPPAAELEQLLTELGAELDGQPGPYILSDLRWNAGPLHVRYGGFTRRPFRAADGQLVQAIADPDGRLVPDVRGPSFELPPWAEVPDFLASRVAARLATEEAPAEFPYRIERPLHFSNGGGVYLATDIRTERQVVLREARPYAGLDGSGRDAVQRLEREHEILDKLAGTGVVPELYDRFVCWEHHFLAEEYIEGQTLGSAFVRQYPLIHPDASEPDIAEYTQWALGVLAKVRQALETMHDHGIVFGDLHPYNVIVRADGEVRFVDLEVASYLTEQQRSGLGAPGYVPPDGRTGTAADRYALACMYVSAFLPLAPLFPLDPRKAHEVVATIERRFPVPGGLAAEILAELRPATPGRPRSRAAVLADALDAGEVDWLAVRESMHRGILASATPDREDRLFPGDIRQFVHNGLGFAYGAAGVLHVLASTGANRHPEYEQWLVDAVRRGAHNDAVGFFDGLHGIAYTLEALGRRDDALAVLERASTTSLDGVSAALFDGLPGIGLNLLHFAARTGDSALRAQAFAVADRLVGYLGESADEVPEGAAAQPRAGLMYGASGHALFFLRLFEATGDREFLDHATTALRRDLDRTVEVEDGTRQMDEGWRVMPYLATGSAGLGLVLNEFLAHQDDEAFAEALTGIRRAATPEFIIGSGLFNGRAGLIALLARLRDAGRYGDTDQPVIERHLRRLAWHVVGYRDNVAFPGDQLLRLSMDVATGTAGVLLAIAAALDDDHTLFPFLAPPQAPARQQPIPERR